MALSSTASGVALRCSFTLLLVALVLWPAPVHAQQPQVDPYSDPIRTLTETDATLSAEDLQRLGQAHWERGYFLQHAAALQAEVAAAYRYRRDTTSAYYQTPINTYFLARHEMAQGQVQQARDRLAALRQQGGLDRAYQTRARLWQGACEARLGNTAQAEQLWQGLSGEAAADLAYARWWGNQPSAPAPCTVQGDSPAALRCQLWATLQEQAYPEARQRQAALLDEAAPDATLSIPGTNLALEFFDPATLHMLALADFQLAAEAFERATEGLEGDARNRALLLAGVSAYEGRLYEKTQTLMETTVSDYLAFIYKGAIAHDTGDPVQGDAFWISVKERESFDVTWAYVASRVPSQRSEVYRVYERRRESAQRPRQRQYSNIAYQLGSALLTAGYAEQALAVLNRGYHQGYKDDLAAIPPRYLCALAHAKYKNGGAYYRDLNFHMNTLYEAYPSIKGLYQAVQLYTQPQRVEGIPATNND